MDLEAALGKALGAVGDFANPSLPPLQRVMCPQWKGNCPPPAVRAHSPPNFLCLSAEGLRKEGIYLIFVIWKIGPAFSSFTKTGDHTCFYSSLYTQCLEHFVWMNEGFSKPENILSQWILSSVPLTFRPPVSEFTFRHCLWGAMYWGQFKKPYFRLVWNMSNFNYILFSFK